MRRVLALALSCMAAGCGGGGGGDAPPTAPVPANRLTAVAHSGDNQSAPAGMAVPTPPAVLVTDANGKPASGVPVAFTVTAGGGSVTGGATLTNANGIAVVARWMLGTSPGTNTLTARAGATVAASVVFTAAAAANQSLDQSMSLEDASENTANAHVGDLDRDGDLDIVLAKGRHTPLKSLILLNDSKAQFGQRHPLSDLPERTYSAVLADLDGDADLDMIVGNDTPDQKRVYVNNGKGEFTSFGTFGDPGWPTRNIAVGDLNGDARPDVVVANRGGPANLAWNYFCLNDGVGRFPACTAFSNQSAATIAIGDMTGDGAADIIVPHRDLGQGQVHVNDGKGGFATTIPFGSVSQTRAIALGDLNGDGRLDIVVGNPGAGGFVFFNVGGASFTAGQPIGEAGDVPFSVATADMDRDGDVDVIFGNAGTPGLVSLNQSQGQSFISVRFGDVTGFIYGLGIGDMNGDGSPDIVAARTGAPSMLYLNSLR